MLLSPSSFPFLWRCFILMDGVSLGWDVMLLLQAQASGHGEAAAPTSEAKPTSHPACEGAPWQTHSSHQI